ncbi:cadherin-related family member 5 isoform X1 [Silurus asotus]|uniref:Cadherin-related family member 5 isoform X1 n=1 Tax=Silurus asotus TaxID=30991 RepID=A0AAD5FGC1_SILAS|nr:cadherin-related family member 5 isoform X1 [Silurus asotus]
MDLNHLKLVQIIFFMLAVFTINTTGQICSGPIAVNFPENNDINATVATIRIDEGVRLSITANPDNAFGINGNLLVAKKILDYELSIRVFVNVENINDNAPFFGQNPFFLQVAELTKVNTTVGKIEATDLDGDRLYYSLIAPLDKFGLQADSNPEILVKKVLDYDTVKEVTLVLFAQDTPLSSTLTPSHTATTSVVVTIMDINNRPPWFQPCIEATVGITKICVTSGYTGNVNLNEQMSGALTLNPGPLHAIDGDKGRNDPIRYTIIGGNVNETFGIDQNNGNITMQKPVGVAGSIILTVMAYELENPDQFATTTVTFQVVISSKHPPQFVKPEYVGFISDDAGIGSLVLESKSSKIPLQVRATDADFSDGVNPEIKFEVPAGSDFRITPEGFIIMTRVASPGKVDLQIRVVDATNGESSTANLSVEVTPGVTTTEMPTTDSPTSTAITTTLATSTALTNNISTDASTAITTTLAISTAITDNTSTDTTIVTVTAITSRPHTDTTHPDTTRSPYTGTCKDGTRTLPHTSSLPHYGLPLPSGDFRTEDMIALGVSLAIALLLCFVVIGFLAYNLRRYSVDWKKLSEVSIFRSSLSGGSGGPKNGVEYTNEGFHGDEDTDSIKSKQEAELSMPRSSEQNRSVPEVLETQHSASALQSKNADDNSLSMDSNSQNASDNTDNEKEVKPILTKERRMEEGYKAVWFKEDIDPNDKEEVVISDRDQDIDHDDDYPDDDDDDSMEEEEQEEEDDKEDAKFAVL